MLFRSLWFTTKMCFHQLLAILVTLILLYAAMMQDNLAIETCFLIAVAIFGFTLLSLMITKPRNRLNEYFIAKAVLFSKYKNIYQSVDRKHIRTMSCEEIQKDIVRESLQLADKLPPGNYRTITHAAIVKRLEKAYPESIVNKTYLGRRSLHMAVYELMFPRCLHKCWWGCEKRKAKKDFYYIEFFVPEKTK